MFNVEELYEWKKIFFSSDIFNSWELVSWQFQSYYVNVKYIIREKDFEFSSIIFVIFVNLCSEILDWAILKTNPSIETSVQKF